MSNRRSKRLHEANQANKDPSVNLELQEKIEKKKLENLERDNYQEDPSGGGDSLRQDFKYEGIKNVREKRYRLKKGEIAEYFKTRFKKTFEQLIEEELSSCGSDPNYITAKAPPPTKPRRKFCEVCGFLSKYNCTSCNVKYCSLKCLDIHKETRCLKYVV